MLYERKKRPGLETKASQEKCQSRPMTNVVHTYSSSLSRRRSSSIFIEGELDIGCLGLAILNAVTDVVYLLLPWVGSPTTDDADAA
jgi:hypothetical protein